MQRVPTIKHEWCGTHVACTCVCQNGIWLTPPAECSPICHDHKIGYLLGRKDAHYPVPAIKHACEPQTRCGCAA